MNEERLKLVTLPVSDLQDFYNGDMKLLALESVGVDNWSGYDDAMQNYVYSEYGDVDTEVVTDELQETFKDLVDRYNDYYGHKEVSTELSSYQLEKLGWNPYYVESYQTNQVENWTNGKYIIRFSPVFNNVVIGEHPWMLPKFADRYQEKEMQRTQIKFDGIIKSVEDLEKVLKMTTTIYEEKDKESKGHAVLGDIQEDISIEEGRGGVIFGNS